MEISKTLRVLVVEDDPSVRRILAEMLKNGQHTVVGEARNGLEAIELTESLRPDVVLMDVQMPQMDGIEASRQISERCPTPIVILTAHDDANLVWKASESGAGAYLLKPVNSRSIERAITISRARFQDMIGMRTLNAKLQAEIAEKKQAKDLLEQRTAQLGILNDIGNKIAAVLDIEQVLARAVQLVQKSFGYHHVALFTLEPQLPVLVMRASAGSFTKLIPIGHRITLGQGLVGHAARDVKTRLANDVEREPHYVNFYPDTVPTQSELSVPIQIGDTLLGVLDVQSPHRDAFDGNDVRVIETLASQIAIAIHNAHLHKQIQQHAQELENRVQQRTAELQMLYELSQDMSHSVDYDTLFRLILQHLFRIGKYDIAATLIETEVGCQVYTQIGRSTSQAVLSEVEKSVIQKYEQTVGKPGRCFDIIRKIERANCFDTSQAELRSIGFQEHVPILTTGVCIGMVCVASESYHDFAKDDRRILFTVASQAADSIQRLRAMLAKEQRRLEYLIENLPEGILLLDAENRILVTNPQACEILKVLNMSAEKRFLSAVGPYSIEQVLREGRGPVPLSITLEDPHFRTIEVSSHSLTRAPTHDRRSIIVLRDVTQARRLEAQMHQQDRLAAVGQLAGGVAHDFNNILTTIILFAQVSLRYSELPERVVQGLETILESSKRAADLVRQILDFSRHTLMETQSLDLRRFIRSAMEVLERTLPESISITVETGPEACVATVDPTRIQQVIMNLAVNARDAMPQGGELQVKVRKLGLGPSASPPVPEMSTGEWIHLTVTDTGTGMSPTVKAHLFEPFFTTKPRGKGTGLGLAQVYGIVKQHSGHITLESEIDSGTSFHIYLPGNNVPESSPAHGEMDPLPLDQLRGHGATVLLVEDEDLVREMGRSLLQTLGYRVLTAADGTEAIRVFSCAEAVELVITDLVMPKMGGDALIRELRRTDPHLKAVAITGYALTQDPHELHEIGIADVVQKPFDVRELAQVIHRVLNSD